MTEPCSVLILISGRGSNMRSLIEHGREPASGYRVAAVLADRADAGGLALAARAGIETEVIEPRPGMDRDTYGRALAAPVARRAPDLIALAGFMRILSPAFVAGYAGRILNIHPSLLPKYPGLHTHRRVLAAGDTEHGATVHFVTAELDAGPAVIQARLAVVPGEGEDHLAARVLALEHRIYPLAVRWYAEGRLACREGRAWLDGRALGEPLRFERMEAA